MMATAPFTATGHGPTQRGPRLMGRVMSVIGVPMLLTRVCIARRPGAARSWLIGAMRLIWCTIDPLINHEARINHVDGTDIVLVSELGLMGLM